jgi:hypothetical protein
VLFLEFWGRRVVWKLKIENNEFCGFVNMGLKCAKMFFWGV